MSSRSIEEILYLSKRTIGYQDRLRLLQKLQKANVKPEYENLIRWICFSPLIDLHTIGSRIEDISHVPGDEIDEHRVILERFEAQQTDFTFERGMIDRHTTELTWSIWRYLYELTDEHTLETEFTRGFTLSNVDIDQHTNPSFIQEDIFDTDTDLPINLVFPYEARGLVVRNDRVYLGIRNPDLTPQYAIRVYDIFTGTELTNELFQYGAFTIGGMGSTDTHLYYGRSDISRAAFDRSVLGGLIVHPHDRHITGVAVHNNLIYMLSYENITADDPRIDIYDLAAQGYPLLRTILLDQRAEGIAVGHGKLWLNYLRQNSIVEYDIPTGTELTPADPVVWALPADWFASVSIATRNFTESDNLLLSGLLENYTSTGMSINQTRHKIYFGYRNASDEDQPRYIRVHSITTGDHISDEDITPQDAGDTGSSQGISALATSTEWIFYARNFIRRVRYNGNDDTVVINLTNRFVDGMAVYREKLYVASSQTGTSTGNRISVYDLDGNFERNILEDNVRRTGLVVRFDRIYYTTVATNEVTVIDNDGNVQASEAISLPASFTSRRGLAFYLNNMYVLNENPFVIKKFDRQYSLLPGTEARGLSYDEAHQALYVMRENPIKVRRIDRIPRRSLTLPNIVNHSMTSEIMEQTDIDQSETYESTQHRINWIRANKRNYPAHSLDYDLGNATGITAMTDLNDTAGMQTDGSSVIFIDADNRDFLYPDQLTVIGWLYLPEYTDTALNWIMGIAPYWDITISNNSLRFRARSNLASRTWSQAYLTNAWNSFMLSINLTGADKGAVFRLNNHNNTATFDNTNQVNVNQNNRLGIFGFDFGGRRALSGVGMSWLKIIKGYQTTENWYAQTLAGYTDLGDMEIITAFDFVQSYQPTPYQTAGILYVGN